MYALFNRTRTRGGAKVLEELFRYPLAEEEAINKRSGVLRYFALACVEFPFQSELFDVAELYLANADERTKIYQVVAALSTLGERFTRLIGSDNNYKAIYKGVVALLEILHTLNEFAAKTEDGMSGAAAGTTAYRAELEAIRLLLADVGLAPLLSSPAKGKLTYGQVAEFDVLLRFRHCGTIGKLLRYIYHLDVYIAVAKVASGRGFTFPRALPAGASAVRLEGVYHPLLKNPVPNTLDISPERNVLFLTGANMAGKSTFMKSTGIALYLAHMGFPIPAHRMEFSVLDGMYTTINLQDNLGMGASHFYAEVLRVKKVAKELSGHKNLFVLFDELFRGTNVKDAYEGTVAITRAFAGRANSIFVISTHIIEAGAALRESSPAVRFLFLPTLMERNTPVYTYTLEEGITDDRHGMVIINNEGILEILRGGSKSRGPAVPESDKTKTV